MMMLDQNNASSHNSSLPINEMESFLKYTIFSYITLVLLLGIFLNFSILILFKMKPEIRIPSTIFLLNMIASNIFWCIFIAPAVLVILLQSNVSIENALCDIQGFSVQIWRITNIFPLMFYSYDRYKFISCPLVYRKIITTSKAYTFVAVTWIIALTVPWLPIFGLSSYNYSSNQIFCDVGWKNEMYFNIPYTIILFWFPFTVILYCNINIVRIAHRNMSQVDFLREIHEHRPVNARRNSLLKTLTTSVAITSSFTIAWLPHFVAVVLFQTRALEDNIHKILKFSVYITFLTIVVYPYLFGFKNKVLKRDLRRLFKKLKCWRTNIRNIQPAEEIDENDYSENVSRRNSRTESMGELAKLERRRSSLFSIKRFHRDSTGSTSLTPVST